MSANLARNGRADKPQKPHPDWPLTANGNGQWSKKIRGKVHYFGAWADPDAALAEWLRVKDDLLAGRTPRPKDGGFTVKSLSNQFLTNKKSLLEQGEIGPKMFSEWHRLCVRLVDFFDNRLVEGISPQDFQEFRSKLAAEMAPGTLRKLITMTRSIFDFGFNNGHLETPVRYGTEFKAPSRRIMRLERKKRPRQMFDAGEIRRMLRTADDQLKAMILLGANCGFGQSDCSRLERSVVDLEGGWLDFHRNKTGIDRRCPLWAETIEALRKVDPSRPPAKAPEHEDLVFLTKYGAPWVRGKKSEKDPTKYTEIDSVAQEFRKLIKQCGLQTGRGFYALRHGFETIAGGSRDQVAVDFLMGHSPRADDMSSIYREGISDDRLRAVADHVYSWLFPRPTVG